MMPALKAEIRKLLSIRSTYAICIFFILLLGAVAVYGVGYKAKQSDINQMFMAEHLSGMVNVLSFAGAFIALFLMAHEYRFNTITYTLTANNSRSKVLAAKILAVLGFVFIYTTIVVLIAMFMIILGLAIGGHTLPHQDINYFELFAKSIFFCEGFALAGLLSATIVRNMQASVVVLLLIPSTIEPLLGGFIKQPERWLPFTALAQVTAPAVIERGGSAPSALSPAARGAIVFLIYMVIAWVIAWYLFRRRDAN
jgi:ABC-type transport system involved in multi-copper enzyme maturation permease subunit